MRAVLGRNRLMGAVAALAMALVAAMMVSATAAQAQSPGQRHGFCHSTGSAGNPYVLVVVQVGGESEQAHQSHLEGGSQERTPPDIDLGLGNRSDFSQEDCPDGTTTTGTNTSTTTTGTDTTTTGTDTTTTGTDTTTTGTTTGTTGTGTTTTGTDTTTTTGTDTTGTDTTGTDTTGTDTTGTDTTGTDTTTTGKVTTTTGKVTTTTGKDIIITDVVKKVGYTKFEGVKKIVYFNVEKNFYFIIVDKEVVVVEKDVIVFTEDVPAAAQYQYQYASPTASPSAGTLPDTGGSGLLPLGALVLLLGGGTAAFFAVKRGIIG